MSPDTWCRKRMAHKLSVMQRYGRAEKARSGRCLWVHRPPRFLEARQNPLVSAVVCVLVFGFCTQLGFPTRSAVTLTLVYGLGTIAWPYSKTFASEPLVTVFLLASVYALVFLKSTGRMAKLLLAGGLWGASIMVKLTALVVAPALLLYLVARGREKDQRPRNQVGFRG